MSAIASDGSNNTISLLAQAVNVRVQLKALYTASDPDTRKEAEQWLQNFQETFEAWQACDQLLHDNRAAFDVQLFCAQILRHKVQRDFEELPEGSPKQLRESIVVLLKRFEEGPPSIRTQLALALAGIVVHLDPREWNGSSPLHWIASKLMEAPEGKHMISLLEVIAVLPEEVNRGRVAVRPERRREVLRLLADSIHLALDKLERLITEANDGDTKAKAFRAFAEWVYLDTLYYDQRGITLDPNSLGNGVLVNTALEGLYSPVTFDAAVDAVSELIRFTQHGPDAKEGKIPEAMMPLAQRLVGEVMKLQPHFRAAVQAESNGREDEAMDEETAKGLARLFAEVGETYISLIATGTQEAQAPVEALLDVSAHPNSDIASICFNFWHQLSQEFEGGRFSSRVQSETQEKFVPVFSRLVENLRGRVQYPENYDMMSSGDQHDFLKLRNEIGDTLFDAAEVMTGSGILHQLVKPLNTLHKPVEPHQFREIEATLFCVKSVAGAIPYSDKTMPHVLSFLPRLPYEAKISTTACQVVKEFSRWMSKAEDNVESNELVGPAVNSVLYCASAPDQEARQSAMRAIRAMADLCTVLITPHLERLFQLYQSFIRPQNGMQQATGVQEFTEEVLDLLEALCTVGSSLDREKSSNIAKALLQPIYEDISKELSMSQPRSTALVMHVDRLAQVFRHLKDAAVVAEYFKHFWPALSQALVVCTDEHSSDRVCRACKYALRTGGQRCASVLHPLAQQVEQLFKERTHSSFIYATSEIMKIFGNNSDYKDIVESLFMGIIWHTSHVLRSLEDFNRMPYVADDLFLMLSKIIPICPTLIYEERILHPLFDMGITGIHVDEKDASSSILVFFRNLFRTRVSEQVRVLEAVLTPRGQWLATSLLLGTTGRIPRQNFEDVCQVLQELLMLTGNSGIQWLATALGRLPERVATNGAAAWNGKFRLQSQNDEPRKSDAGDKEKFVSVADQVMKKDAKFVDLLDAFHELSVVCMRSKRLRMEAEAALSQIPSNA